MTTRTRTNGKSVFPIFYQKAGDALEFAEVAGHYRCAHPAGLGGDEGVHGADALAAGFEVVADDLRHRWEKGNKETEN